MVRSVVRDVVRSVATSIGSINTGIPYKSDLNFWTVRRNGLTLVDSIAGNNVTITTPVYKAVTLNLLTGDKTRSAEQFFDGSSYTIFFQFNQIDNNINDEVIFFTKHYGATSKGIYLLYNAGNLLCLAADGGSQQTNNPILTGVTANLKGQGWIDFWLRVDFVNKLLLLNMYKSDGSAIGTPLSVSIAAFVFNANNNAESLKFNCTQGAISNFKKFNSLKTLAQCKNNSYVTDLQIWYPEMLSGTDVSGNGNHLNQISVRKGSYYYSNISTYFLDKGYSLYRSSKKYLGVGYEDFYIPYSIVGVAIDRSATLNDIDGNKTYTDISDHPGNLTQHNLADSKLNIPVAQWDKSSTTIFEDAVRSSTYYDATNTDNWHITELDYLTFSQNCKANHKGLDFFKITNSSFVNSATLTEIFSYTTNKTGSQLNNVLKYTGDQTVIDNSIQLFADASSNQTVTIKVAGVLTSKEININWGDGTHSQLTPSSGTFITSTHIYSGTSIYQIYISKATDLLGIEIGYAYPYIDPVGIQDVYPLGCDIKEYYKAVNLELLRLGCNKTKVLVGSINGLPLCLKELQLLGAAEGFYYDSFNTISGDATKFTDLEIFQVMGKNTITVDVTGLVKMKRAFFGGYCVPSGSVSGWTQIELFEGTHTGILTGTLNNSPVINNICYSGGGNVTIDITGKTAFTYLSFGNGLTVTGSITGLINFTYFGTPALCTGSYAGMVNLVSLSDGPLTDKILRFTGFPKLYRAAIINHVYTSAEINQILADMVANKDLTTPSYVREIQLYGGAGSGAPTGQGLTDKAYLQTYHSPNNNIAYPVWTILTR
jgi:hypothetical protein